VPTVTPFPTPTPTLAPLPTPTATQIVPIINHPSRLFECEENSGDCGSFPRRVICAPDGWFVDVERDWGALPVGWRETYVETSGSAPLVAAGESGCF